MSKFLDVISATTNNLNEFIKKYEILEDKEPIDNELIKKFKKLINSFYSISSSNDNDLEINQSTFIKNFDDILNNSSKQTTIINKNLNTALENIKDQYSKKEQDFKKEISDLKKQSDLETKELLKDIDFFFASAKQREAEMSLEYDENIKRYNYQIESAKDNYNDNINSFNKEYLKDDKLVKIDYDNSLKTYDESAVKLVERLNEKIDNEILKLTDINKELAKIRLQMKEKFHQESVTLNGEIKTLVELKNNEIVKAREIYNKALSSSSLEKNDKKNSYLAESQKILKDYVFNVTELDDYSSECKTIYSNEIKKEKLNFYTSALEIIKKENDEINYIINENSKYEDSEKYTKKLIKKRHQYYFSQYNNEKNNKLKKLTEIEAVYKSEFEQTRNNKELLDLEKNYSLKILNEKEQSDNKYYQELDSIYENDMNLLIKVTNMKFNQQANIIKCKSRIRSKSLERELDYNEAKLQKDIEKIQNSIDKYQFEINGTTSLQKILHDYEEKKYNLKHNHLTVTNLIEIEKCKVLKNYNVRQYNHNVLTSKTNLDYSKNKLYIENDKFKKLAEINIDKNKAMLHRDVIYIAYKIKENQIYEDEDKQIQNRNTQYQIDSISHDVLFNRFKYEIKIINQTLATFISLFRNLENFSQKFLSLFYHEIKVKPEYLQLVKIFILTFQHICDDFYIKTTKAFNDIINETIKRRVDFEEKFKFQTYYNDLSKQYEEDKNRLTTKLNSINDTIENYSRTIEIFNSRNYNYKNQNILLRQKMYNDKNSKLEFANKVLLNKNKINENDTKILEISKLKKSLEKEKDAVIMAIKNVKKDYNKRVSEIKLMQYNSAISFYNLKENINNYTNGIINDFNSKNTIFQVKYFNTQKYVDQLFIKLKKKNNLFFKDIYNIIEEFNTETKESITKDKKLLFIKFNNDLEHINNNITSLIDENKLEYTKNLNIYLEEINKLNDEYKFEDSKYDNKLDKNEKDYQKTINTILDEKGNSLTQFYREYYAMCDNLDNTNDIFNKEINQNESNFQLSKNNLTKKIIKEKTDANISLQNFNKSKEELINHLPQAEKFFATQVTKEIKDLNFGIETEIKELKSETLNNKRLIQRNITSIESNLEQTIIKQLSIHQKEVMKEKRAHQANLRKIEKTKYAGEL